ncbi:MAG: nucleotidyltransferase family protein [Gammaproteobacteria bacterium]|nr:nucleotidyltransferase family protein [Gammaproteobacteria bacterium]
MKTMILAAGRGERLKPLTDTTPKPMLQVGGKPLIAHQLGWLAAAGLTEVVINLHHLGEQIERFCASGQAFGTNIRYSHETDLLETGGGVVNALPLLGEGWFVVLNGDIYTDFPFASLPHSPPDWADIHLLLTPTPEFRDHGDFDYADGRVTARGEGFVYCGIAMLRAGLFKGLAVEPFSLQQTFFRAVQDRAASAQIWDGYWTDIGSPSQLQAVNERLQNL